ncbi:glucosidase 2 subunit beta-like isoform X2 [Oppia nitens]|uniref:glucosidase 2 subunit beta-like isoform X2 n=1 Tax=Oppia nitens TaxID=1686743 RepID=UPI0023DCABE8|nr:glucosidase 2 subunit beta-like isoform X2 [Oppia nitens]
MLLNAMYNSIVLYLLVIIADIESMTEVLRPRGVSLDKKIFYDANKDFQCLDGSASVPFMLVNDDYCDCDDGSDEPGTNACPNGHFYCSNLGYIERIVPSSRVNDGICDCCDASDEYNSSAKCPNNCLQMGEQLRQEREQHLILLKEGNAIREKYVEESKQTKENSKHELEELNRQKLQLEEEKNAKEAIKRDAEDREKAALDVYKEAEDKIKKEKEEEDLKRQQEDEIRFAEQAFKEMDLNKDNILSYTEVQQFIKFDKDGDGTVSDDEAKVLKEEMGLEEFIESGWVIMKPFYMKDKTLQDFQTQEQSVPSESESVPIPPIDTNTETEHESETPDETEPTTEEDEDEDEGPPPFFPPKDAEPEASTTEAGTEYDDETKRLIENAKQARDEYSEVEGKFLDIQNKIREIEVLFETDFGPNDEFMALKNQCFELTDLEYTYKFCPFDSASQRPKNGGTETSLGRWGKWIGDDNNKYRKMLFEGGAQCWNGPVRTVTVNLSCGTSNEVIASSEPSRCEYAFEFKTPAVCWTQQHSDDERHVHSEL